MTITKTTVLDLEPANANWVVTVEREDYTDPDEAPGILLSVGRTTVMLTPAEARALADGLIAAGHRPVPPVIAARAAATTTRVIDLMAQVEASLESAKAKKNARNHKETTTT